MRSASTLLTSGGIVTQWSPRRVIATLALCLWALAPPLAASAQSGGTPRPAGQTSDQPDQDLQVVVGEPDYTLGALPTTLRMPSGKFDFRMTHRFSLAINSGTTADFFKNFFNFDSAAQIGFEVRYGLASGTQLAVHRTNERTIQLLGQRLVIRHGDSRAFSADVLVAVEGRENLSERFATTVGAVVSRRFGTRGTFYVEPMVTLNANTKPNLPTDPRHTGIVGVGTRLRVGRRTYVVAEVAPRVSGFAPGFNHASFGLEKRAGGHMFQLTVANNVGTTLAQVARGGTKKHAWYIGFNLTRRFF
jgi:hypothetical protein